MSELLLNVEGLVKRFGGLVATDHVSLEVRQGEVHALIGPNGAGKTTLIAQLSGSLASDAGQLSFDGADITALPQHERVRRGLARSYQITSIFNRFSVRDNVALAVQARSGSSMSCWRGSGWANAPTRWPATSRMASNASLRWAWRWPHSPNCCCSTSRWPAWARRSRRA